MLFFTSNSLSPCPPVTRPLLRNHGSLRRAPDVPIPCMLCMHSLCRSSVYQRDAGALLARARRSLIVGFDMPVVSNLPPSFARLALTTNSPQATPSSHVVRPPRVREPWTTPCGCGRKLDAALQSALRSPVMMRQPCHGPLDLDRHRFTLTSPALSNISSHLFSDMHCMGTPRSTSHACESLFSQ